MEALTEALNNVMVDCGEVISIAKLADTIIDLERNQGFKYTNLDIYTAWHDAADGMIDSYIQNEYDTADVEHAFRIEDAKREGRDVTADDIRTERIAAWEAQRPSNVRRAELAAL